MTITQVFLLLVCAFVLVLLLSILFKRYHRIIMWSAAIVFFIGTLLLIGLGIIDPVKDNHPDPVAITGIVTALILSGLFAYGAEKLHIKPPTVNVTVQRLEKAGFLYREADEKDQRISRIYMTEKGKQAKESGMKKVQDNEKILLDGFSEEDLCLLRRFLDQITENIEKIPVASGKNNTRKERQQK